MYLIAIYPLSIITVTVDEQRLCLLELINFLFLCWAVLILGIKEFTWETVVMGKKKLLPFGISYAWE